MATGQQLLDEAKKFLGDRYVYGASGPSEFDCSGLIYYSAKQIGLDGVPRTADEQYQAGEPVALKDLQPGDLVFSAGSDGTATHPGHVGIYAGVQSFGRQRVPVVLEAPHTGDVVKYLPLDQFQATGYRRIKGLSGGSSGGGGSLNPVGGIIGGIGAGLSELLPGIGIPVEITGAFVQWGSNLTTRANLLQSFFQPSTYVRAGAGVAGALALMAGLVFLLLAAGESS